MGAKISVKKVNILCLSRTQVVVIVQVLRHFMTAVCPLW